jgi:hypothetical protein
MPTAIDTSKQTLNQLLERAAAEKDRDKFLELLREIGEKIAATRDKGRTVKAVSFRPSMETDTFDIFAGPPDRHAVWRESVVGIDQARKRIEEIAAASPGEYFLFHEASQAVLARINSRLAPIGVMSMGRPGPASAWPADILPFPAGIREAS